MIAWWIQWKADIASLSVLRDMVPVKLIQMNNCHFNGEVAVLHKID